MRRRLHTLLLALSTMCLDLISGIETDLGKQAHTGAVQMAVLTRRTAMTDLTSQFLPYRQEVSTDCAQSTEQSAGLSRCYEANEPVCILQKESQWLKSN